MKVLVVKSLLEDSSALDARLAGIGLEMSPVIWQHERVYVPHGYRRGQNYARLMLRTEVRNPEESASYSLRMKRHIEDSGVDISHSSTVIEYTEVMEMIHQLGYRKVAEVSRQRRELWLDERTAVFLDDIEGLSGTFLKIEAQVVDEPIELLVKDLYQILRMLGQETMLLQTYAELLNYAPEEIAVPEVVEP